MDPYDERRMVQGAQFRLFGFPVTIRPGFVVIIALIAFVYGGSLGPWLAGSLAGFTLIHELGHATVARHFGARASIALDLLYGYASYVPSRYLARWERALIAAAGPAVEIAIGLAVLLAMGANPLSLDSVSDSPASYAIWWAGPVIGLLNLVPALPLDGGSIASLGLDRFVPGRGRLYMTYVSLGLAGAGLLAVIRYPLWRPGLLVVALIGASNYQELRHHHRADQPDDTQARMLTAIQGAEEQAWATGRPGLFPPGIRPSPWFQAHQLLGAGRPDQARALLLTSLEDGRTDWVPPRGPSLDDLRALVTLLPRELPTANRYGGQVMLSVLEQVGELRWAADYGAKLYRVHAGGGIAHQVSRALALLGYDDDAAGWLRAAIQGGVNPSLLRADPDLAGLRARPDIRALLSA
jgi:Zn-dependent protease